MTPPPSALDARDYASIWRRLAAAVLDLALFASIVAGGVWSASTSGLHEYLPVESLAGLASEGDWRVLLFLPGASLVLALALTWRIWGATPGQLMLECRVVEAGRDTKLDLPRALWRALSLLLAMLPLGLGVFVLVRDPRAQGWHDKLAGTVVIREDESRLGIDELAERLP